MFRIQIGERQYSVTLSELLTLREKGIKFRFVV